MAPAGIVLAAGRGRRFDPDGIDNKLLQPLPSGEPVVVASARAMRAVLPYVLAVTRPGDAGVADALRSLGCDVCVCPDADVGMGASLAWAVRHSRAQDSCLGGWLVALGDMPFVQTATISRVCEALIEGADIVAPVYRGRRGHPVGFAARHGDALQALTGEAGARHLLASFAVQAIAVEDAGVVRDIDARADLAPDAGRVANAG